MALQPLHFSTVYFASIILFFLLNSSVMAGMGGKTGSSDIAESPPLIFLNFHL
ncbi:MAG: hypothetical protein ACFE8A_11680 [Candidatus Hodarchaeota archaeon]